MNSILQEFHQVCEVYTDDIVIFSKSVPGHASHLRLVLARLEQERFYAKPSKFLYAVPCIDFCGFQVIAAGISTQPDKIARITNWHDPSSVKEVRSFLGVCGFYQRFIHSYAKITAPLIDLLKKFCVWHLCLQLGSTRRHPTASPMYDVSMADRHGYSRGVHDVNCGERPR